MADDGSGGRAAVYMVMRNNGTEQVRATAVSTEVAEVAEFHQSVTFGDVAQMRPVEAGIAVPPGGEIVLEPGGYHVMLIGVTKPLTAGESFQLDVTFVSEPVSQTIAVSVAVEDR